MPPCREEGESPMLVRSPLVPTRLCFRWLRCPFCIPEDTAFPRSVNTRGVALGAITYLHIFPSLICCHLHHLLTWATVALFCYLDSSSPWWFGICLCIHSLRTTRQPVIPTAPLFENDFGVGYAPSFFGVGVVCKRSYDVMMCVMNEGGRV